MQIVPFLLNYKENEYTDSFVGHTVISNVK